MTAPGDHNRGDAQDMRVPGGQSSRDTHGSSAPGGQVAFDAHHGDVPGGYTRRDIHASSALGNPVAYEIVRFHAAMLDEAEHARKAAENRLRAMLDPTDRPGAKNIPPQHPAILAVREAVDRCWAFEHQAELELCRAVRKLPLAGWVKRNVGVGEKQAGRLIAAVGDPAWNAAANRPRRGPAELFAYCGYHVVPAQAVPDAQARHGGNGSHPGHQKVGDAHGQAVPGVAPQRRRGEQANWKTVARARARRVAASCIRHTGEPDKRGRPTSRSPYRDVYDAGRVKYEQAVHTSPCPQCGGQGPPAPVGSPLSPGHQHARALRLVAREILKDLWREARAHG